MSKIRWARYPRRIYGNITITLAWVCVIQCEPLSKL